jgi:uncharacterized protein (TIGR02271 family)
MRRRGVYLAGTLIKGIRHGNEKGSTVVGAYHDAARAQEAVRALKKAGFRDDQIGVVSHDTDAKGTTGTEKGSHMVASAATGVAAGAGVGALWALGIAAGVMPVIGPVIAGGILASVLASAAGGAAIAGLVGALVGLGIPEEDAHFYQGEFEAGRTIVTLKAEGRYDEAWKILHGHDAYNRATAGEVRATPRTATPIAAGTTHTGAGQTVKVHEEQLHATKTPVKTGEVHVRKEVVTEQKTIQVPVTREEVVIERHPVSGLASSKAIHAGEEIRFPVSEEKVHVSKETVVKEEVSVGKRKVTGTEQVSGNVRKEEVKVVTEGDVKVTGDTKSRK